jgi:cytochrome P450
VAFGFGVDQCLGQPLARVELQVVYSTLYRRIPTLRPAVGLDRIPRKHDGTVYGVPDFRHAVRRHRMLEQIREAARTGRRTTLAPWRP